MVGRVIGNRDLFLLGPMSIMISVKGCLNVSGGPEFFKARQTGCQHFNTFILKKKLVIRIGYGSLVEPGALLELPPVK